MIDLTKLQGTLTQVISLANLGGAVVQAGAGVVSQVVAILRTHGYEVDTSNLDELIADAERRRQIAANEKNATE